MNRSGINGASINSGGSLDRVVTASASCQPTVSARANPAVQRVASASAHASATATAKPSIRHRVFAKAMPLCRAVAASGVGATARATCVGSANPKVKINLTAKSRPTCTPSARGYVNIAALDPPERTVTRPATETDMTRPFIDRTMRTIS